MTQVMKMKMRRKRTYKNRDGKKRDFYKKKKSGKAYIVGDWLTDIDSSSGSSDDDSDNEKVVAIAIDLASLPPPLYHSLSTASYGRSL